MSRYCVFTISAIAFCTAAGLATVSCYRAGGLSESPDAGADAAAAIPRCGWTQIENAMDAFTGNGVPPIAPADFNGDGEVDLAIKLPDWTAYTVAIGRGDGTFSAGEEDMYGLERSSVRIVAADFTGDGIVDLALSNYDDATIDVLEGMGVDGVGDGAFEHVEFTATDELPADLVSADFNDDGFADLAVESWETGDISVLLATGADEDDSAVFGSPMILAGLNDYGPLLAADFDGDGAQDIAVAGTVLGTAKIFFGNGAGAFEGAPTFSLCADVASLAVVDFDEDGTPDLAAACREDDEMRLYRGDGEGAFALERAYAVEHEPSSVAAGDFDGDGAGDFAVACPSSELVVVLLGDGSGEYTVDTSFEVREGEDAKAPETLIARDLNGDGVMDFVVITNNGNSYLGSVYVLLGACGG